MLKPKAGDLVRLKPLRVEMVSDSGCFSTNGAATLFQWNEFDIEEILPRPFAAGDRVVLTANGNLYRPGVVIAIHQERAWVQWEAGHGIEKIATLSRFD